MHHFLHDFLSENKIRQGPVGQSQFPCPFPHTASYTQTSSLSVNTPLLLMGTLVEDEADGRGGSIPGSLEYLILEPPFISAVVPLSQV